MTPHTVKAWRVNRRTGAVRGDLDAIIDAFQRVRLQARWDPRERAYVAPLSRFDDVLAALELDGHSVDYEQALW